MPNATSETTEAASESRPANLKVSDLARMLAKRPDSAATQSANRKAKTNGATAQAKLPAGDRETPAADEGGTEAEAETLLEQSAGAEAGAEEGGEEEIGSAAEAGEGEETATEEASGIDPGANTSETETETDPEAAAAEEEAKALDPVLLEAIEIAKAQDGGKGKAQLLKRLHKLVDDRDTERMGRLQAEEQTKQLRAELQQAKAQPAQSEAGPASAHPEVAKLETELQHVDGFLNWMEDNPDGGELPDGKGGTIEFDAKQVSKMHRDLARKREEIVARKVATEQTVKQQHEAAYSKVHAIAEQKFPWLKNPNSAENQELQAILRAMPMLKQFPDYEMVIGYYFSGRALDLAKEKAKINGATASRRAAPAREPTRVVAQPSGARTEARDPKKKAVEEAESKFKQTGRASDLAKSFAAKSRANRGN